MSIQLFRKDWTERLPNPGKSRKNGFRCLVFIMFSLLSVSCSSLPDIKRDTKYQTPSTVNSKARLVVFWPQPPSERTTTDAVKIIVNEKYTVILGTQTYALLDVDPGMVVIESLSLRMLGGEYIEESRIKQNVLTGRVYYIRAHNTSRRSQTVTFFGGAPVIDNSYVDGAIKLYVQEEEYPTLNKCYLTYFK